MSLQKPALDPKTLAPRTGSGYPEPYRSRVLPREKRALGDALGLTKIGINHTTLMPGKESSMRHWHTREDEFVYVLSGEVVVKTDAGEQLLTAGTCAGFPASADGRTGDGHQLINRGTVPAVYLEISNREAGDQAFYPDVDLVYHGDDAPAMYTRRDGSTF
ncbi:MAG TPA: cupin domain-containing protein [Steroidobacteraceae bacterium]|nr:cupin domain-containing protein [Steroidobacteraceae bacterium]